jgi:hypothetical protein
VTVGDRIVRGFLPGVTDLDAEVIFTRPYTAHGHRWAFLVLLIDGAPEPQYYLAEAQIPVIPGADPDRGHAAGKGDA